MVRRFHVIQGGKDKEKGPGESGPRLFRAHSTGNFAKGEMIYSEVTFNWYCMDRAQPHVDCSIAIADHTAMGDRERRHLERTVDRYLSEIEVAMLASILDCISVWGWMWRRSLSPSGSGATCSKREAPSFMTSSNCPSGKATIFPSRCGAITLSPTPWQLHPCRAAWNCCERPSKSSGFPWLFRMII